MENNKKMLEIVNMVLEVAEKEHDENVIALCDEIKDEEGRDVLTVINLYHNIRELPLYERNLVWSLFVVIYYELGDLYMALQ